VDHEERSYRPHELYDLVLEFTGNTRERQRMYEQNLSPCLHAVPILGQFISFLHRRQYERDRKESERQWDQFVASVNDRAAQKAVPVCARCGTESSIGQIRLDNILKWVCPDCAGLEERQGDGRFGSLETGPCLRNQSPIVTKAVYSCLYDEGTGT
jgi:hypothetical protein